MHKMYTQKMYTHKMYTRSQFSKGRNHLNLTFVFAYLKTWLKDQLTLTQSSQESIHYDRL